MPELDFYEPTDLDNYIGYRTAILYDMGIWDKMTPDEQYAFEHRKSYGSVNSMAIALINKYL